jgi:hypothetical protein
MSRVVKRFLREKAPGTTDIHMTLEDAAHYTPEQRAAIIAKYPEHEREARARGIPTMGSGAVFPVPESQITVPAFAIPPHWPRIAGLDFGWDHPTAAAWLAWDRDTDTIYVTDVYRARQQTPVVHAAAVKSRGAWIPVAWPHDGLQHDKGGGVQISEQYRAQGCNVLHDKATHAPAEGEPEGSGGNSVEAGLVELLDRMLTGRFKVFSHLVEFFEEFRMYHRDNGVIVKEDEDVLSAMRYAYMMRRYARTKPSPKRAITRGYHATTPGCGY